MIGENTYRPDVVADPDKKMLDEFKAFVAENKFSADQVRKAYEQVQGIGGGC